ncbi:MAG: hypothetical protein ACOZF0_24030 [Thermodesulfobacteriota bacterium]
MNGKLEKFTPAQLDDVNQAVSVSEELVGNYYKLSINQWLRHRYDVKTLDGLEPMEIVHGPFAQIVRYKGRKKDAFLGSSVYDFYKICLQDHAILAALREHPALTLFPFCLYIVTHELVHIIRFSRFLVGFDANPEEKLLEESRVHQETHQILRGVQITGMPKTFSFFRNWGLPLDSLYIS